MAGVFHQPDGSDARFPPIDPDMSPERFDEPTVPKLRPARFAPYKFAFANDVAPERAVDDPMVVLVKFAPLRSAPVRFALERLIPVKFELRRNAFVKLTLLKFEDDETFTPFKFAPLKFEFERLTLPKLAFPRIAPRRSSPLPKINPLTRTKPVGNVGVPDNPPVASPVKLAPERLVPESVALVNVALVKLALDMFEPLRLVPIRRTFEKFTPLKLRLLMVAPERSALGPTKNPPWVSTHGEGRVGCAPLIKMPPDTAELSVALDRFVPVSVAPVRIAPVLRSVTVAPDE